MDDPSLAIALLSAGALWGAAFVCAEAGIHALGELRLRALREEGGPFARIAGRVLRENGRLHTRLLVGRLLGLTVAAASCAYLAYGMGGRPMVWIGTASFVMLYAALLQLLTTVVRRYADRVALVVLRFVRPFEFLVVPISFPLELMTHLLDKSPPKETTTGESDRLVELEVEQAIAHGREEGALTREHAALLRSALEFKHTRAREVMVPRRRIIAFESRTPIGDVLQVVKEEGHSRYPVYRDKLDQIEGMLFAKDLLRAQLEGKDLNQMALEDFVRRPAFFCDENRLVGPLLREMQSRRSHLAMVVDEFGGTSGLITLEDVLEEIVGEIQDEDDEEELQVQEVAPGRYIVDADVSLYDLEEYLGERIHDETGEFDSVGGLLIEKAGRVPTVGESIQAGDFDIVVQGGNPKHVTQVEVVKRS